ncbi:MAG: Soluble epoxide hydrolase [Bradyrhizobium sp.]|nr:Soluble epoxide hydrolase [Bradyrhizobium sp.]MEA2869594.1 hypothetical protein [Bradyrhizobium sp.]
MPNDARMADVKHGTAEIEPGTRIHYVTAGEGKCTAVLFHGFPQTWWAWRHVIPKLADAGFRVPRCSSACGSIPGCGSLRFTTFGIFRRC